ncbi:hypothetical protein G3545_06475 [Starkeya sp. ORNL1]|jgi:hypothetical protein|uniref:hypothetical protein n=1 Tax=Starkeya sp. ORNL1 TaxID=2709380 RepID=UPI00146291B3|nr:hypothetical protein [Starkeya sp. ORNL1]QJP13328.1 hypothetical protein G3545_06475 [Starkeya sp. ORNL1]
MTLRQRPLYRLALVTAALGLALAAAGCETLDALNPFDKEKKLSGTRVQVFPEGVPGVDYNAAPPQPATAGSYGAAPTPESPAAVAAKPAKPAQ